MQRDEIGLGQQVIQRHYLHAHAGGKVGRDERIERDQSHPKARRAAGHFRTHASQADDAQGLVAHLDAHERGTLPLAFLHRCVGLGYVAGQRQHQRHSVLRGSHRVADGCIYDRDAGTRGSVQVDVVHADAGTGDDLQVAPGSDHGLGDLGLAAHHQRVVPRDGRDEFFGRKAALDVDADVLFQQVDALGVYVVGDEYFGHKKSASSNLDPIGRTLVKR